MNGRWRWRCIPCDDSNLSYNTDSAYVLGRYWLSDDLS